jgi:hypothetical protein
MMASIAASRSDLTFATGNHHDAAPWEGEEMPNVRLAPKSVAPVPEETGARTVTVAVPGYGDIDVVFSEAEAVQLVRTFQQGFVERTFQRQVTPAYPSLHVTGVDIAHGDSSGVMAQTAEIGSLVLTFDASLTEHFKAEIDRATDANQKRTNPI